MKAFIFNVPEEPLVTGFQTRLIAGNEVAIQTRRTMPPAWTASSPFSRAGIVEEMADEPTDR